MFQPVVRDYDEYICSHCGAIVRVKKGEGPPTHCYACNDGKPTTYTYTHKPGELPPIVRI